MPTAPDIAAHRLAISGAAGRMGRALIQAIAQTPDFSLGAALVRPGTSLLGADAGELAGVGPLGIALEDDLGAALDRFDTLIDFSLPEVTLAALEPCRDAGKRLVVGTTGFDASALQRLADAARHVPVLLAPNMSVAVNLAFKLVELAARTLGEDNDVEIYEVHHRDKIDAPSGTALRFGEVAARALGRDLAEVAVYQRQGRSGPRPAGAIGFASLRAGDIVGEHTVLFAGAGERLEITHRAESRMNFAQGALRGARFLAGRSSGLFDMQDVLGLADR